MSRCSGCPHVGTVCMHSAWAAEDPLSISIVYINYISYRPQQGHDWRGYKYIGITHMQVGHMCAPANQMPTSTSLTWPAHFLLVPFCRHGETETAENRVTTRDYT